MGLACAVRQPSLCARAFCESGVLFRMSHLKLHFALHTSHCTLHTPHFTLHIPHFTLHSPHFTLHPSHSTLHTSHFTVHTSHFKNTTKNSCCCVQEHNLRAIPVQCNVKQTTSSNFTLHSSHFTLHTSHLHFISTNLIWTLLISFYVFSCKRH